MGSNRERTDFIAVHCSATPPSLNVGVHQLRTWHTERGWADVGYHLVITRDGTIEAGRPLDDVGAHVAGFNNVSLALCLVGGTDDGGRPENNFTSLQLESLLIALRFAKRYAPLARIQGHRDFPEVRKACPSFDVRNWLAQRAPELL